MNKKSKTVPIKIHTESLVCGYNSVPVIKDINITLGRGVFYGIMGPNGCGKSTLLKTIVREIEPLSGTVYFEGKNLTLMSRREIARRFSVVPQSASITFPFTVRQVVMMGRRPFKRRFGRETDEDIELLDKVVTLTDTVHLLDKYITELSGGERQLVFLARTLIQTPEILFLDEATSNLDINHTIKILQLVKCLTLEQGVTVFAVMHDLNLASIFCDYLVLLSSGGVYAEGETETVLTETNIRQVFDAEVIVRRNQDLDKLQVIPVLNNVDRPCLSLDVYQSYSTLGGEVIHGQLKDN